MRCLIGIIFRLAVTLLAVVLLLGLIAFLLPHQVLTVDSGNVKGDVIVVLGGGTDQRRPERAAELYREGNAPLVLVSGFGDTDRSVRLLMQNGVPESAIRIEGDSMSTLENARFSVPLLRRMGARRIILVTSWYHSRRALACFESVAPDLTFYSRPCYWAYARRDWNLQDTRGHIEDEDIKLLGYWICYGIWPFTLR
jgi:uncharacterized SAM-binding protein YcdF (DUF218 family)